MEQWEDGYASGIASDRPNALIAFFHGKLTSKERQRVLSTFASKDSTLRASSTNMLRTMDEVAGSQALHPRNQQLQSTHGVDLVNGYSWKE